MIGQEAQVTRRSAALPPVPETRGGRPPRILRRLRRPDWTLVAPAAVTLGVMLWGIATPSYWRDESATLSAVNRSVPQLLWMLGRVDAVHGLYYLLMWPVVHCAGSREFDTRLPSAAAMAAAALGVAAIGRRVRSRRAGLHAGLVFAALPLVTVRGHDARPYAFETAAAVLATYLLLRAAEEPGTRRFGAYGLSLVVLGYLHLFGLLIVPAHALALIPAARLAEARRGTTAGNGAATADGGAAAADGRAVAYGTAAGRGAAGRGAAGRGAAAADCGAGTGWPAAGSLMLRWLVTCAAVGVAMAPLIWLGWEQRQAIAWMPPPTGHDVSVLVASLAAGTAASAVIFAALIGLGAVRADWPDQPGWLRLTRPAASAAAAGPAAAVGLAVPVDPADPTAAAAPAAAGPAAAVGLAVPVDPADAAAAAAPAAAAPAAAVPVAAWAGRPERTLTRIAGSWLVLPPAALLIAAQFRPVYEFMYVEYCLPAVALLVGAGLAALGWPLRFAALGLVVILGLPAQLALRQPLAGGFIKSSAEFLAGHEKPGDGVYYPGPGGVPAWDITYPRGFAGLRDIQLGETPAQSGLLAGTSVPLRVIEQRLASVRRLWLVEETRAWLNPPLRLWPQFRLALSWQRNQMRIRLYVRSEPRY